MLKFSIMKKISIAIVFAIVSMSTVAMAQEQKGQRPAPPSAEEMIKKATEELSLSDEQVAQWTAIHKKYDASIKERAKAEKNLQAMGKELEATLNEAQQEKFEKMRKSQGPPPRKN